MKEAGSHLSRSTLGGDTVKWIGRSTLVVMSTIAIVATGEGTNAMDGVARRLLTVVVPIEEIERRGEIRSRRRVRRIVSGPSRRRRVTRLARHMQRGSPDTAYH